MKKLTKKSRWMLYLSLFISGVVIFSTVFYVIAAKDNSNDKTEQLILIIIIIVAVLAVLSMLLSRMKLKKNTKHLSPAFFEAYEKIADQLNGTAISTMERKETMSDILDLFLLADKDGRQIQDVVGENISEFVSQIQQSFGYRSKLVFNFLTGVQYSIMYLFMMQGAEMLKAHDSNFFNLEISVSIAFLLIPLAFFGVPLMVSLIRKGRLALAMITPIIIGVIFIAVMETMDKYFLHIPWVYTIAEGSMNIVPNTGMLSFWVVLLAVATLLKIIQRKISIKRL